MQARFIAIALFAFVLSVFTPTSTSGQFVSEEQFGKELRPFDFTDEYYKENGVNPDAIANRRTGLDRFSVIDFIDSGIHRNVRITGTWPVDDDKGDIFYVAPLGEVREDGFTDDSVGREAINIAHRFPFFVFPSAEFRNTDRQAAVAEIGKGYFENNPLGLSVMVSVEYTKKGASEDGQKEVKSLLERNGKSLDGTFAIRRVSEIDYLTWRGFVTQKAFGPDGRQRAIYKLNHVIKDPTGGAISPDANLVMILDQNRHPLVSEMKFVLNFECLQRYGRWCK